MQYYSKAQSNQAQTEQTLAPEPKSTTSTAAASSEEEKIENGSGPFDAVVVDAIDLPPVRSNVDPSQPLR